MNKCTPAPWRRGGIFNPDSDHASVNIWGPTAEGKQSGTIVAYDVSLADAPLIEAAPAMLHLLGLIAAEFKSDPTSVQCFDNETIVQPTIAIIDRLLKRGVQP